MLGGLKRQAREGRSLPMNEVMGYLRGLQGCKWPALVIYDDGSVAIVDYADPLVGKTMKTFNNVDELLTEIKIRMPK